MTCIDPNAERVQAKVVGITDGDTISVNIDGQVYKLRYIGVDCPESSGSGGSQATKFNASLVQGKTVTLIKDVSEVDKYDRLLRYVFVGDTFVNYELVRAGYAKSGSWPPDTACDQIFAEAYASAQFNKRGLWAPTPTPRPYIRPTSTPGSVQFGIIGGSSGSESNDSAGASSSGSCDSSYPGVCIAPYPPDLDCGDVPYKRFQVNPPDPHGFDRDGDGVGCEN